MSMLLSVRAMESGTWHRSVSFDVPTGDVVVLLGRNSSGKTTLLNTIAGLLPVRAGEILIDNADVTAMDSIGRVRKGVRIAVEGRHVFPRLAVKRNLLLGAYGTTKRDAESRLDTVLHVFPDLVSKLDSLAWSLSGGQQTMLNVGRALMGEPRLLLLDEPMLGLDPQNTRKLITALRHIRGLRDIGVVVAEQSAVFARSFPERVMLMNGGEILFDGSLGAVTRSAALAEIIV